MTAMTYKQYIDVIYHHSNKKIPKAVIKHFVRFYYGSTGGVDMPSAIKFYKVRSFEKDDELYQKYITKMIDNGYIEIMQEYSGWGWMRLTKKAIPFFTIVEFFEG